ncbi:MAG: B12-binding domain-containing radical SAM protein [bacterium]
MNVLLINPPFIEIYGNYSAAAKVGAQPQMPLGICYIAAALEKGGHKVTLIDSEIEGMSVLDLVELVKKDRPRVVGVTGATPVYNSSRMVLEKIKEAVPEVITVMGGFHITALPDKVMEECPAVDYGIVGEGEVTVVELLKALEDGSPLEEIKGVIYRGKNKIMRTPARPPTEDLDSMTFPARHLLRMDKYIWSVMDKGMVPVTSIITQRGCPAACIFCGVQTMFPGKTRYRSVDNILDEIQEVIDRYGVAHIMFCDDTLTLNRQKVVSMCGKIKERGLRFTFEGYTRANTVTLELLEMLKEVGLVRLSFGVETGNQEIMKAIKKGVRLEEIKQAYAWCGQAGIETRCSLMLGHPFETRETIEQTIAFAKSLDCSQAYINITTPYPGCELYEMAKKGYGGLRLLTNDWKEYRRYGNAVMEMNDLTAHDLIEWQNKAYKEFYMRPRIIWDNMKRAGFKAAVVNSWAFFKSVLLK